MGSLVMASRSESDFIELLDDDSDDDVIEVSSDDDDVGGGADPHTRATLILTFNHSGKQVSLYLGPLPKDPFDKYNHILSLTMARDEEAEMTAALLATTGTGGSGSASGGGGGGGGGSSKYSYLHRSINDTPEAASQMAKEFDICVSYLNDAVENGGKILVHCRKGISRSSTIMTAYLMVLWRTHPQWVPWVPQNIDSGKVLFHATLDFLKGKRSIVHPNKGFRRILKAWANTQIKQRALARQGGRK